MPACSKCGQQVTEEAAFCSRCGAALKNDWSPLPVAPADAPPPLKPATSAAASDSARAPAPPVKAAGPSVMTLVGILAILFVLLIMAVVVCGGMMWLLKAPTALPGGSGSVLKGPGSSLPPTRQQMTPIPPAPQVPSDAPLVAPTPAPAPEPPPTPDPVADRKVKLKVTSECWDDKRLPFNVRKDLIAQFKHQGITVVDNEATEFDATIEILYREKAGDMYEFGAAAPKEQATNIALHLAVLKPDQKDPVWTLDQEDQPSTMPLLYQGDTLYTVVLKDFRSDVEPFSHAGLLVSGVLGQPAALLKLEGLLHQPGLAAHAVSALRAGEFEPLTATDRVRWALAEADFDAAEKEGAAAAEPVLEEYIKDREDNDYYVDSKSSALESLGKLGGPAATKFLLARLHAMDRVQHPEAKDQGFLEVAPVQALITALVSLKATAAEKDLDVLCNDANEDIADAAQDALKTLNLKLPVIKPRPEPKDEDENPQPDQN